jgi:two-component system response regulator FixJ
MSGSIQGGNSLHLSNTNTQQVTQRHVYIVDDDSAVRRALSYALRTAGYEVRPFASGVDFLESLSILPAGCVLLDLRMPERSGMEVLDQLGEQLRKFPTIVITGYGDLRTAVEAIKMGASDFFEKPFTDEALLLALDAAFTSLDDDVSSDAAHAGAVKLVASLSRREQETLQGLVDGMPNKAVAHNLGISVRTVEMHRSNLMQRLGVKSIAEAAHIAIAAGLKPL